MNLIIDKFFLAICEQSEHYSALLLLSNNSYVQW